MKKMRKRGFTFSQVFLTADLLPHNPDRQLLEEPELPPLLESVLLANLLLASSAELTATKG